MNVLEIEGLSVSFQSYGRGGERVSANVIERLDLTVAQGEILAVVGASGSGKSLLAHAILGILPRNAACSGSIRLNGKSLDRKELLKARGRTLALLPQSVGYLNPLLSVGRQLRGPYDEAGALGARRGLLSKLGLGASVERLYPFQLSGGMARKLLLAMSTSREASLIVADEPTPGMGAGDVAATMNHFRELAMDGTAVLMITHDLEAAAAIANRVAVMKEGAVVEIAPAASFSGDGGMLRHPYSRSLWQALPKNGFGRATAAKEKEAITSGTR
jgi:peptide/nickel transport system ATP-binding protein